MCFGKVYAIQFWCVYRGFVCDVTIFRCLLDKAAREWTGVRVKPFSEHFGALASSTPQSWLRAFDVRLRGCGYRVDVLNFNHSPVSGLRCDVYIASP